MRYEEYYETYYGGNPTLYQTMFIGHSASGFETFKNEGFFLGMENAETDTEGFLDLEKLSTENRKKIDTTHVWQHSMGRYLFDYSTDPLVHHHLLLT